jgi:hypothetical protein
MYPTQLALECTRVEALWLAALFPLDQGSANSRDLSIALLFAAYEVADVRRQLGASYTCAIPPSTKSSAPVM